MPQTTLDHKNYQGGKEWGRKKKQQEEFIDEQIQEIIRQNDYPDIEDLSDKLEAFKGQFISYDIDGNGDLNENDVRYMMEKLGQPKNTLEIKKMIKEVDLNNSGTINFGEFVRMMLGNKSSILKLILMFEEKKKEKELPSGPPPKKSLSDLP